MKTSVALTAASLASVAMAAIDPIVIKGNKFFMQNSGEQFYIRGVAYQQGVGVAGADLGSSSSYTDPLADSAGCSRDIPYLQKLNTNTIRVYAVDPNKNHDDCMSMLADAGIYVIADLSEPDQSINRFDPSWDDALYTRYVSVVNALQKYDNVIGFFAGNEVSNTVGTTDASAFVKAAVRDTKAYIKAKGFRAMGVGYATNDDADIRDNLAHYMDCGDEADAIDFWGYNIYEWCSPSDTFQSSGYQARTQEFANFDKPAFFAEYGCIEPGPRLFTDTPVIYGPQMNDVWSGGIVYMYFQEANNYGLVNVNGNSVTPIQPDFNALSKEIRSVTPTGVQMDSYSPTNSPAACPANGGSWHAASSPLPPPPNPQLCQCMVASLNCKVKDSVAETAYGPIFKFICGDGPNGVCDGIAKDATKGDYGAYSMCQPSEQLSWVMNRYAETAQGSNNPCDFDGKAETQDGTTGGSTCQNLLNAAGTNGGGTPPSPTSIPTGTDTPGAAGSMTTPKFDIGFLVLGTYTFGAMLVGMGMILL